MNQQGTARGDLVTYHREGFTGFITLNRPEKRNAMNLALWTALDEAIRLAEDDQEARVIIVRERANPFAPVWTWDRKTSS